MVWIADELEQWKTGQNQWLLIYLTPHLPPSLTLNPSTDSFLARHFQILNDVAFQDVLMKDLLQDVDESIVIDFEPWAIPLTEQTKAILLDELET